MSSTFQPAQNGRVTFQALAGQRLKVSVPSSTFAAGELGLRLLDPAATKLVHTTATADGVWLFQANKKGTYKIVLDPAGIATGTSSVKVAVQ